MKTIWTYSEILISNIRQIRNPVKSTGYSNPLIPQGKSRDVHMWRCNCLFLQGIRCPRIKSVIRWCQYIEVLRRPQRPTFCQLLTITVLLVGSNKGMWPSVMLLAYGQLLTHIHGNIKQWGAAAVHPPLFDAIIIPLSAAKVNCWYCGQCMGWCDCGRAFARGIGVAICVMLVDETVTRSPGPPRKFVLRIDVVIIQ